MSLDLQNSTEPIRRNIDRCSCIVNVCKILRRIAFSDFGVPSRPGKLLLELKNAETEWVILTEQDCTGR
jgi:hypothetical protein